MTKTMMILNKHELRQKGWKLFAFVASLQILFLIAGYFLTA
ncbi:MULTISPECIES: KGW motif small protein [unclassified Acinetobacter]|nr:MULTISPECIES: KGW motif small protein [unclassified Acinetobacter]SEL89420.1 hypothetical protein SAMN05216500_10777 [Acinetobacter sp. DSM 11652]